MITLHHCPQTRSMRSLWLLHELGIEFEVVKHAFGKNLRDPNYLVHSRAGRVPAHAERAEWLIWVHFSETISQHTAALTQQYVALYDDTMRSPIVMKLEAARLAKCYAAIEARLTDLGTNAQYLLASGFSAADVSVGQAVYMARHFATLDAFPKTSAWYKLISERPAFQASLPKLEECLFQQEFFASW